VARKLFERQIEVWYLSRGKMWSTSWWFQRLRIRISINCTHVFNFRHDQLFRSTHNRILFVVIHAFNISRTFHW